MVKKGPELTLKSKFTHNLNLNIKVKRQKQGTRSDTMLYRSQQPIITHPLSLHSHSWTLKSTFRITLWIPNYWGPKIQSSDAPKLLNHSIPLKTWLWSSSYLLVLVLLVLVLFVINKEKIHNHQRQILANCSSLCQTWLKHLLTTHEVYAAPIWVPVCKWYINCNNRQLANNSTTLDKSSFSSTWL